MGALRERTFFKKVSKLVNLVGSLFRMGSVCVPSGFRMGSVWVPYGVCMCLCVDVCDASFFVAVARVVYELVV